MNAPWSHNKYKSLSNRPLVCQATVLTKFQKKKQNLLIGMIFYLVGPSVNFCLSAFLLSRGHKTQKSQVSGAPVSPLLFFIYLPVCLKARSVQFPLRSRSSTKFAQIYKGTLITHPSYWVRLLLDFSVKGWESMMTHPDLYLHNDTDQSRGPSALHLRWYWAIVFPCWNDWLRWCYGGRGSDRLHQNNSSERPFERFTL